MSRWKTLSSKVLMTAGFFRLREDRCELPDGRVMPRYYVFDFADWVNVLALDEAGQVILVRQHRHAASGDFLEIPGGSTDPEDVDPSAAAARELLEETGYAPGEMIFCGAHFPNPALQSNRMHTYLALGCRRVAAQSLDPYEDLTVELRPLPEVLRLWLDGAFTHSLIAASIGLCFKELRARGFEVGI